MQTSNVQSVIGTLGTERGKTLPSQPTHGNAFGALFSQLEHENSSSTADPEIDETESSETEFPDKIPLESEAKRQQPQATKIAVLSSQESHELRKKTVAAEVPPAQTKAPENTSAAEQVLVSSKQASLLESDLQKGTNIAESTERFAGVKSKSDPFLTHQLQSQDGVFTQAQRSENTKFQTQNLQQIPSLQHSNISNNSRSQNPLTLESSAQEGDLQLQVSRQTSIDQQGDKPSAVSVQVGTQIPTNRNGFLQSAPSLEQTRDVTPKSSTGEPLQLSAPQKPTEWIGPQPNALPAMTARHSQSLPLASSDFSATQFFLSTPETGIKTGQYIDNFFPTAETVEGELGPINVTLSPSTSAIESARAGTVRFAGSQMIDALIRQPNQPVEVALNPEELGRVRISLKHLDSGLSVAITAERPETLDLMRRHIEQLEAEFRQLGYENIGFEFSGGDANSSEEPETNSQLSSDQVADAPDPKTLSPASVSTQTTGLDIRL